MNHYLNKAGIARLLVDLGAAEIYVSPRISLVEKSDGKLYQEVDYNIVEGSLARVDSMTVITIEIDLLNDKVWIKTADTATEVSSYHNNGTGPVFRDSVINPNSNIGAEFCELNNQDGVVRWFKAGHRSAEFTTPRGERTRMNQERIDTLVAEVRSLTPRVVPTA